MCCVAYFKGFKDLIVRILRKLIFVDVDVSMEVALGFKLSANWLVLNLIDF